MNAPARIDPVTLEVLRGRFDAVADEMEHAILRSAYSTIVTEALDATAAVFDARGRTVSQACAIPVHLGTLTELGLRFATAYPAGVAKPGDLYMINDPYCGGTHLPDIAVAAPVFCAGELVGYVATMTHHQDVGGAAPGSTSTNVYDHHSEGLRIPMLRFGEGGRIDEDVLALLTANSRSPHNMRGDLMAQVAGCATGERRLAAVFADYGIAPVRAAIDALMDYAERLTRLAIDAIPDGEYAFTDWLDNDGTETGTEPVRIQVAIRVAGTAVEFDFDGSAPQVRSAINNVASSTLAAVYYAIRTLTGNAAPNNDGCYRPITLKLPEASVVNAAYPAPINARGVALARIADVVMGAMAKAVPSKMPAAGCGHATVIHAGAFDRGPASGSSAHWEARCAAAWARARPRMGSTSPTTTSRIPTTCRSRSPSGSSRCATTPSRCGPTRAVRDATGAGSDTASSSNGSRARPVSRCGASGTCSALGASTAVAAHRPAGRSCAAPMAASRRCRPRPCCRSRRARRCAIGRRAAVVRSRPGCGIRRPSATTCSTAASRRNRPATTTVSCCAKARSTLRQRPSAVRRCSRRLRALRRRERVTA